MYSKFKSLCTQRILFLSLCYHHRFSVVFALNLIMFAQNICFFSLLQIIMPLYKLTLMCLIWSIDEPKLNAHKQNTDYIRMLDVLQWTPKTICGQNDILVHVYWEIGLNEYIKPYDQAIACQCIFIFRVMFVSITICLML